MSEYLRTSAALKIIGSIIAVFGAFNGFCLISTGVLFHTLVSNPEIANSDGKEKMRLTDLIQSGYFLTYRITVLRCMAVALDLMLIQTLLGYLM
jgi:hypothetical protein